MVGAALPLLLGAACGTGEVGPAALPGQLEIVTALYPFQFVAERVAGDRAVVTSLTRPGAEPHDVELTPRQVAAVSRADLVIYERTFQAAVDEAVEQTGNPAALDTTTVVPMQPLAPDEHGHGVEGGEVGSHDEHGGLDPHVWLDPTQVVTLTNAVSDRLSALDPEHASEFVARAATLVGQLDSLDRAYATGLARCERTEFMTTHAAFGYLAKRYGLTQIGISGLSPDAEPSPARIAEVQAEAREHELTTIFSETLVSPALAQSIAGDLGLKTDLLDPLEGITAQSRGRDYLAVMESNLDALRLAGGCA